MQTRTLGSAGPRVSIVGLGGNNFGQRLDQRRTTAVVHTRSGCRHHPLRHRRVVRGRAVRGLPGQGPGWKARFGGDLSLKRLGTDHIDLYYQHHPDPEAPVEESLEALMQLQQAGKVVHIGCPTSGPSWWRRRSRSPVGSTSPGSWPTRSIGTCSPARRRWRRSPLCAGTGWASRAAGRATT